jgi:hypothetical protein
LISSFLPEVRLAASAADPSAESAHEMKNAVKGAVLDIVLGFIVCSL